MKKHMRSIISGILVITLCLGMVQVANETTIDEEKKKADALESEKDAAEAEQAEVLELVKSSEKIAAEIAGKTIVKEIYVKGKLVNIVAK